MVLVTLSPVAYVYEEKQSQKHLSTVSVVLRFSLLRNFFLLLPSASKYSEAQFNPRASASLP